MKKTLLLGIATLAVGAVSSYGQGFILLDNYSSINQANLIVYGAGVPGETAGDGIKNTYTVGVYFGQGSFAGAVAADPSGTAIPTSLNAALLLGAGTGSTAAASSTAFDTDGRYQAGSAFQGNSVAGATSTFMIVAYSGADYASSLYRGHSAAFQMVCQQGINIPTSSGEGHASFQVLPTVPEPSTLALAGLGLASMLIARRRK